MAIVMIVARYRSREEFRHKNILMGQISSYKRDIRRAEVAIQSIEVERIKVTRKKGPDRR